MDIFQKYCINANIKLINYFWNHEVEGCTKRTTFICRVITIVKRLEDKLNIFFKNSNYLQMPFQNTTRKYLLIYNKI